MKTQTAWSKFKLSKGWIRGSAFQAIDFLNQRSPSDSVLHPVDNWLAKFLGVCFALIGSYAVGQRVDPAWVGGTNPAVPVSLKRVSIPESEPNLEAEPNLGGHTEHVGKNSTPNLLPIPRQDSIDPEAVRQAISHGVDYLKQRQLDDGSWPKIVFDRDTTALGLLALLNATDDPNDPAIRKGITNLLGLNRNEAMHYVLSLRIMVLAAADPRGEKYLREIKRDTEVLLNNQLFLKNTPYNGGWSYGGTRREGSADSSNTQFVLLALHEAARLGVDIPNRHWKFAAEYWENCQDDSGGFSYVAKQRNPSHSMTCAGIASWVIVQENLADMRDLIDGDVANCCAPLTSLVPAEAGLSWLAKNFTVRRQSYPKGIYYYYLYGLERAGRLTGRRFIGSRDWYRDGVQALLPLQNRLDGSWVGNGMGESSRDVSTSLALLFLSKGKRPVAISQYQYGQDANWNRHPQGVHYLTRRLEDQWKQKLNWQTIPGEVATAQDLSESPILFLSGSGPLQLDQKQIENLRAYFENGGFMFAEACQGDGCEASSFDQDFRELMTQIFPESELEALDPAHPIWSAHYPLLPNSERPLLGLTNCCRTVVVYCPRNLSCYWQLDQPAVKKIANDALRGRIEYCTQLGTNVCTYATGRSLKDKGENSLLPDGAVSVLSERIIEIPKLNHSGGSNEAKNALRNLMIESLSFGLRVKLDSKLISPELEQLVDYPFIFMHGTSKFEFSPQQRIDIRKYLDAGGFIFADAVCSSPMFSASFRTEMEKIHSALKPIPANHEIWRKEYGQAIDLVTLRTKDNQVPGGFRLDPVRPLLEGLEINGKLAVIFSPHDLSCALESNATSQCEGYIRQDAIRLGIRILVYTLSR